MSVKCELDRVCELQSEGSFVLTGFYLSQADMDALADSLTPDVPDVGALGRYRRVPVFLYSPQGAKGLLSYGRVHYTMVRMDVVD